MRKTKVFVLAITLLCDLAAKPKRAKVAIINFINETGSKNYAYLKTSLSGAVYSSMKENFRFHRSGKERTQHLANQMFKSKANLNTIKLRKFVRKINADFVAFGYFTKANKGKITITARLYAKKANRIITSQSIKAKTDTKFSKVSIELLQNSLRV